jgi:hypothetical protein
MIEFSTFESTSVTAASHGFLLTFFFFSIK